MFLGRAVTAKTINEYAGGKLGRVGVHSGAGAHARRLALSGLPRAAPLGRPPRGQALPKRLRLQPRPASRALPLLPRAYRCALPARPARGDRTDNGHGQFYFDVIRRGSEGECPGQDPHARFDSWRYRRVGRVHVPTPSRGTCGDSAGDRQHLRGCEVPYYDERVGGAVVSGPTSFAFAASARLEPQRVIATILSLAKRMRIGSITSLSLVPP
jgi:hypothetical protein